MQADPRSALVLVGRHLYDRGWMAATAGNLSARADAGSFWITASGVSKGALTANQFVRVAIDDGAILECGSPSCRPSAEVTIHRALYSARGVSMGACLHGHSLDAVLAVRGGDELVLPRVEMVKGLGVWDDKVPVSLPVFANHKDVPRIAADVERFLATHSQALPALIVRDHGVTAWGRDVAEALQHLEAAEFLLSLLARGFTAG